MTRRSLTLWLVALVCFGPFALAIVAYYGPWGWSWLPQLPGDRELVTPAVSIAPLLDAEAPRRWKLVYAKIGPCEAQCAQHLDRLRQVHWALGGDLERVQRVYLHTADAVPPSIEGELVAARLDTAAALADERLARALDAERIAAGRVYIADPLGNLVVSYPPDVEQKELLRDLERLLDASGIG